jgi:two-component system, NtrC family, nitrogen regulation sensor histidine kinase NtrY
MLPFGNMGPPAMVLPLAAGESADAAVLSDQPQSRSSAIFLGGLALAAALTAVATITLLLGGGLAGESNALISGLLIASLVLCAGLAGIFAHRLVRVARAWRQAATGARLHVRFVTLFSLAALAPVVVVAAFLGFTFSPRVKV